MPSCSPVSMTGTTCGVQTTRGRACLAVEAAAEDVSRARSSLDELEGDLLAILPSTARYTRPIPPSPSMGQISLAAHAVARFEGRGVCIGHDARRSRPSLRQRGVPRPLGSGGRRTGWAAAAGAWHGRPTPRARPARGRGRLGARGQHRQRRPGLAGSTTRCAGTRRPTRCRSTRAIGSRTTLVRDRQDPGDPVEDDRLQTAIRLQLAARWASTRGEPNSTRPQSPVIHGGWYWSSHE